MSLLVCAATEGELSAWGAPSEGVILRVTGVGVPATFASLHEWSGPLPTAILNIGIAGAYPGSNLEIGDLVLGTSEVYGDIGFTLPEPPHFLPITESPFGAFYKNPLTLWVPDGLDLAQGRGCTVNTCTGTQAQGEQWAMLFEAQFETMEGAAIAQWGQLNGILVSELRAISNVAAERDMRPENIALSIKNLAMFLAKRENRSGFFHSKKLGTSL
jgi:nucleoside phosphorylase